MILKSKRKRLWGGGVIFKEGAALPISRIRLSLLLKTKEVSCTEI